MLVPLASALLPAFTRRYTHTGEVIEPAEGEHMLRTLALFNMCVLLGFLCLGSLIIRLTYGVEFEPAITVLMVLASANFFETFRLCTDPLLNSVGAASTVSRIEIIRYVVMLPVVLGFSLVAGAVGAACGVLLVSLISVTFRLFALQKRLYIKGLRFIPRFIILVAVVMAGWKANIPSWIIIITSVLIGRGLGVFKIVDLKMLFSFVCR